MRAISHRRRNSRAGFVVITGAAMAVGLVGFLGLAADVGYLQWTQRRLQTAADSGALAGALEVLRGSTGNVTTAADSSASLNGATNGSGGVTITVNNPPASGNYTSDSTAVEVIIKQTTPLYFMGVFGVKNTTVGARAVARLGGTGGCVYTLDPAAAKAFYLDGAFNVTMGCGAMVDSNNANAMYLDGAINWTGPSKVVGNYGEFGAISMTPLPTTGVGAQTDPLSYVSPQRLARATIPQSPLRALTARPSRPASTAAASALTARAR